MLACARAFLVTLLVLTPIQAISGPADDADALFARWKAAYDANDNVSVAKLYATDAILHGTRSRDLTVGREAITKYFTVVVNTGNKVEFRDHKLVVINPTTMLVVGFNDFMRNKEGKLTPEPARFTMVLVKQDNDWVIAHHHSSLRPPPKD
jgi:uncharacterized protein (TIGR02246 family)